MAATITILIDSKLSGGALQQVATDLTEMDKTARGSAGGFSVLAGAAATALGGIVVNAASAAAGAVVGFVGDSIKAAGGFEANMNQFAAAAGSSMEAAGLSTQEFSDLFLDLGAKLPVSTLEVQEAAIALVKGGIDPAIIAAGGLESSLNFAAAAGMELEAAADLSVKMLGTFTSVTDDAATKTAFMAEAQDLLTKAANASTLDVASLGDAMLAAGGQARAAGLDYEDFVTAMGLISPAFGSAAEAGTSFKNFLVRLNPTTKPATEAMQELGLMSTNTTKIMKFLQEQGIQPLGEDLDTLGNQFTEFAAAQGFTAAQQTKLWDSFNTSVFYDMNGEFVGVEQSAQLLQDALGGLTDQERVMALQTIFGNDAMGAAAALADGGAEAYQAFAAQMANANGVAAQSAAVNQGFDFAMQNLSGTIESVQIKLGMALLPTLGQLVTLANQVINAIMGDAAAFAALPGPLQSVITFVQGLATQAQALMPIVNQVASALAANWQPALAAVAGVITALVAPALAAFVVAVAPVLVAVGAAIAIGMALYEAWNSNFLNIQSITTAVLTSVQALITSVTSVVLSFWQENGAQIIAFTQQAWNQIKEIIGGLAAIIASIVAAVFGGIASFISEHGAEIQTILTFAWNTIQNLIDSTLNVIQGIVTTVLGVITGDWETASSGVQQIVEGLTTFVTTQFENLKTLISGLGPGFLSAAQSIGQGIIDGIINGIKSGLDSIKDAAQNAAQSALDAAKSALGIQSPSKAFATLGLQSAQGFALGVSSGAPQVQAAASGMGGAALGATSSTINRNVSRVVNYSPTYNRATNSPASDRTIAAALAGV